MHRQVLVQVGFLCEALVTAWLWADKRSLLGVDSEMVKEIMPFAEKHFAVSVVAFQQFYLTLRPWILVFEDSEESCGWHFLLNLDRLKVKVLTRLYVYFCANGDLLSNLVVGDVISVNLHRLVKIIVDLNVTGSRGLSVVSPHVVAQVSLRALIVLALVILILSFVDHLRLNMHHPA